MDQSEHPLTPAESLRVIASAITRTKDNFREQSFYFLLWGWLIAAASLLFFALRQYTSFRLYFLPFPVLATGGIALTLWRYSQGRYTPDTYLLFYLKRTWMVLGIAFIAVVFLSLYQHQLPFTYTLLLAGIGTLISGMVMKFPPMTVGGVLFLALSVASVAVADAYKPLLQASGVVVGFLVPGYWLKSLKEQ